MNSDLTTAEAIAEHDRQMEPLRAAFLREWEAENKDTPMCNEKAMKLLRDWGEFLRIREVNQ